MLYEKEAIRYHSEPRPGKIEVVPLKPCVSQSDLSLAYTPGVAVPSLRIQENPNLSFEYTSRGSVVGVEMEDGHLIDCPCVISSAGIDNTFPLPAGCMDA